MEPTFEVTVAAPQVVLKEVPAKDGKGPPSYKGQASFTVTNSTAMAATGTASVLVEGTAPKQLFSIAEPRLEVPGGGTVQLTVDVTAPAGTPPGSYSFRALVANSLDPDEDSTPSPTVTCVVPAQTPKKPFPWWILIVAAVVLIGGFFVVHLLTKKSAPMVTLTVSGYESEDWSGSTIEGKGISCPTDCTESYPVGTTITLQAKFGDGYDIVMWSANCQNAENQLSCTFVIQADMTVIASFD